MSNENTVQMNQCEYVQMKCSTKWQICVLKLKILSVFCFFELCKTNKMWYECMGVCVVGTCSTMVVDEFRFDIRFFLLPGKVVESKRNPLSFRSFLVLVASTPVPDDKVAESYEMADNDDRPSDFDDDDDDDDPSDDEASARTRIIRG